MEQLIPVDTEKLKQIQIQILDTVHEFCEKHGIKYWLDSGTLLGAVRHKGYIPWDDDIDLGMLRPDFDKFMKTFNEENEKYKAYCYENNKDFPYAYGKVMDTDTVLYEAGNKNAKTHINIDVFVYDNAPVDDKELQRMYEKRDKYNKYNLAKFAHTKPSGNLLRRAAVRGFRLLIKPLSKGYFVKKIVKNSKKYSGVKTELVGNFTGYLSKFKCEKSIFDTMINMEFEGKIYNAPSGYDTWLTLAYGNYMQLPPEEKRISHHTFEAYINENHACGVSKD